MRNSFFISAAALAIAAAASCGGQQQTAPPEPMTSSAPQPQNQPITVVGCLRAGEASDTFVLTAAAAEGSTEPATYQLVGAETGTLREHVGDRVEVSGSVKLQQDMASRTTATEQDKAKGTTGTPIVETQTHLELRTLEVSSVKPLQEGCEPGR